MVCTFSGAICTCVSMDVAVLRLLDHTSNALVWSAGIAAVTEGVENVCSDALFALWQSRELG